MIFILFYLSCFIFLQVSEAKSSWDPNSLIRQNPKRRQPDMMSTGVPIKRKGGISSTDNRPLSATVFSRLGEQIQEQDQEDDIQALD